MKSQVGIVRQLFRYPVKSMLGESLDELDVGERGIVGDRAWALREQNGRIVTAKKWANLLDFSASYDFAPKTGALAPVSIVLPGGRIIHAEDADASNVISAKLDRKVTLDRARTDEHSRAEIDPETVFGDVGIENIKPEFTRETLPDSFALSRGSFFDDSTIHFLTTASLARLHSLIGDDARVDARRLRPNIVIETDPRMSGFVEDEWIAGSVLIGETATIVKMKPALRCVMTTHRQADLARDLRILRAVAQNHSAELGIFASVGAAGKVRVGDPVWLMI